MKTAITGQFSIWRTPDWYTNIGTFWWRQYPYAMEFKTDERLRNPSTFTIRILSLAGISVKFVDDLCFQIVDHTNMGQNSNIATNEINHTMLYRWTILFIVLRLSYASILLMIYILGDNWKNYIVVSHVIS